MGVESPQWVRKLNICFMISPDYSMPVYTYLSIEWQNKRKLSQNILNYRFRYKCNTLHITIKIKIGLGATPMVLSLIRDLILNLIRIYVLLLRKWLPAV